MFYVLFWEGGEDMQTIKQKKEKFGRSALLDCLRGFTVVSMVLYHAMWDMVNMFGVTAPWFHGVRGFVWQQATCCTFILLSGFCSAFGSRPIKRGAMVLVLGAAISAVTILAMPEEIILFGVLTLIGSCMMFVGITKKYLVRIPAWAGLVLSFLLFAFFRNVNDGTVGVFFAEMIELPKELYSNYLTAYLGFPHAAFRSTDYFSVIPWIFLFLCGFFLFRIWGESILAVRWKGIPMLNLIGRKALLVYVLHQPVIYGLMLLCKGSMG